MVFGTGFCEPPIRPLSFCIVQVRDMPDHCAVYIYQGKLWSNFMEFRITKVCIFTHTDIYIYIYIENCTDLNDSLRKCAARFHVMSSTCSKILNPSLNKARLYRPPLNVHPRSKSCSFTKWSSLEYSQGSVLWPPHVFLNSYTSQIAMHGRIHEGNVQHISISLPQ